MSWEKEYDPELIDRVNAVYAQMTTSQRTDYTRKWLAGFFAKWDAVTKQLREVKWQK